MEGITLTVSQLNDYVRRLLASDPIVQHITLRGEISNFKPYASGHWYFTLKDDTGRIDCALFRQYTYGVPFMPQDGMRVLVTGSAGLYVQGGKFQFYADGMTQDGVGDLYRRYLEIKERLTAEGLFDASRKRPLPLLPRAVGIVTSESGAVQHDIRTVAGRRFPGLPLVLRPAQVQGDGAAQDIVRGIEQLSRRRDIDVIIVGRGGGSIEDLWAFNDERVARAIYDSELPVISAVGHEPDVTIADYVADVRASTPSNAAELAVPDRADVEGLLSNLDIRSRQALKKQLTRCRTELNNLKSRKVMTDPMAYVDTKRMELDYIRDRLTAAADGVTKLKRNDFVRLAAALDAMSPLKVLGRGYCIAANEKSGELIRSINDVEINGRVDLCVNDGTVKCRVEETEAHCNG